MSIKQHLDTSIILWHSVLEEMAGINSFLNHEKINEPFYRRLLIRGIFSIIETYLNVTNELIKVKVLVDSRSLLDWEELAVLSGKSVRLDDKGKVFTNDEYYKFEPKLRFTLNKFASVFGAEQPNYGTSDFQKLTSLIKKVMV